MLSLALKLVLALDFDFDFGFGGLFDRLISFWCTRKTINGNAKANYELFRCFWLVIELRFCSSLLLFFFRLLELSKTKTIKCLQPRWRRENKNMCIIRNWIFFCAKGKTNKWKKIKDLNKFGERERPERKKIRWNYFNLFLYFMRYCELLALAFVFSG